MRRFQKPLPMITICVFIRSKRQDEYLRTTVDRYENSNVLDEIAAIGFHPGYDSIPGGKRSPDRDLKRLRRLDIRKHLAEPAIGRPVGTKTRSTALAVVYDKPTSTLSDIFSIAGLRNVHILIEQRTPVFRGRINPPSPSAFPSQDEAHLGIPKG